jgi:hypothetical protein
MSYIIVFATIKPVICGEQEDNKEEEEASESG